MSRVGYPKTDSAEQGWETSSPWQRFIWPLGLYITLAAVIAAQRIISPLGEFILFHSEQSPFNNEEFIPE